MKTLPTLDRPTLRIPHITDPGVTGASGTREPLRRAPPEYRPPAEFAAPSVFGTVRNALMSLQASIDFSHADGGGKQHLERIASGLTKLDALYSQPGGGRVNLLQFQIGRITNDHVVATPSDEAKAEFSAVLAELDALGAKADDISREVHRASYTRKVDELRTSIVSAYGARMGL